MTGETPSAFRWGAATAAFQIEGAPHADGKGPGIWDVFCATPGKTVNGDTGDLACDHYRRWREDVELMRRLGLNAYRFSVSWPRVLPTGRGGVNGKGLDFYDRLVDALLDVKIRPMATLYHWDLPAALQMELGGWASGDLPKIFSDYAEILYRRLGDRVGDWLTINEPWVMVVAGYFDGVHAPGIQDKALGYRAGHNLMRAHAYAVAAYRNSRHNRGQISFALNTAYSFPATDEKHDIAAAERQMLNFGGWFGDPAWFGDYPAVMRERLGSLLPRFSDEDTRLLRKSMDYIAINYYTSDIVRYAPGTNPMEAEIVPQPDTPKTEMGWPIMPDGFYRLLLWLSERYGKLPVYVTENGAACPDRPDNNGFVQDNDRIAYLDSHIDAAMRARRDGVDLRGYYVWSLLDNLEWSAGFEKRFGIVRCDPKTQNRTIKASGRWYADLIASGGRVPAAAARS